MTLKRMRRNTILRICLTFMFVILLRLFGRRRSLVNEGDAGHALAILARSRLSLTKLPVKGLLAALLQKSFGFFRQRCSFFVSTGSVTGMRPDQPELTVRQLRRLSRQAVRLLVAVRTSACRSVVGWRQDRRRSGIEVCRDRMKRDRGKDHSRLVAGRQAGDGGVFPGQAGSCRGPLSPEFVISVSILLTSTRPRLIVFVGLWIAETAQKHFRLLKVSIFRFEKWYSFRICLFLHTERSIAGKCYLVTILLCTLIEAFDLYGFFCNCRNILFLFQIFSSFLLFTSVRKLDEATKSWFFQFPICHQNLCLILALKCQQIFFSLKNVFTLDKLC